MTRISMKKSIAAGLASALCLMFGAVQADQNYGSSCGDSCNPCGTCPDRCFHQCVDDQCGFYLGADLLFWTACQKNLNCFVSEKVFTGSPTSCTHYTNHFADYDWSVGYRIWGGYRMGCDDWDLHVAFTHWDNDATGTFEDPDTTSTTEVNKVHCSNDLDYDVIDILLGRSYQLGCDSQFKPFIGFRGVWLDQNQKVIDLTTDSADYCVPVKRFESNLFARGLHAGSAFHWEGCEGFGVWAVAGASLLEADVNNKQETNFYNASNPVIAQDVLKEDYCLPFPGYNIGVGLDYECCFCGCEGESIVRLGLGYEFHHWFCVPECIGDFNEDEVPDFYGRSTGGALLLHGLTFRVGYYF